jgi:hypothetical protein
VTTEEPTQLDRIEAKLDEVLRHVKPVEVVDSQGQWFYRTPRRRWWQFRQPEPDFDVQAVLNELNKNSI